MVDSRDKGARAEAALKKYLRDTTKLDWQRTPGSGALDAVHKLKGDLYVVDKTNVFCVEVKHYAEDHLSSKVLTGKNPQFIEWWKQAVRQGVQIGRHPLLIFKFDRSKWFVATTLDIPNNSDRLFIIKYADDNVEYNIVVSLLEDWIDSTPSIKWVV